MAFKTYEPRVVVRINAATELPFVKEVASLTPSDSVRFVIAFKRLK